jgi:hypothetical protein
MTYVAAQQQALRAAVGRVVRDRDKRDRVGDLKRGEWNRV